MDALFPGHLTTGFDAIASVIGACLYLAVGFAALVRAPRDGRSRVFFVTAITSLAPYAATTSAWTRGMGAFPSRWAVGAVLVSLVVGSVAVFHFMQVFPWRRPWIRSHDAWLTTGYVLLPLVTVLSVWRGPGMNSLAADVPLPYVLAFVLMVALPLLVLVGLVIPFAGMVSLYKTWREAKRAQIESARITTFWILISQLAGGALTILVVPVLDLAAPHGWWTTAAAVLLFGFALLMPIAFALGVWKYHVLEIDPELAPLGLEST